MENGETNGLARYKRPEKWIRISGNYVRSKLLDPSRILEGFLWSHQSISGLISQSRSANFGK